MSRCYREESIELPLEGWFNARLVESLNAVLVGCVAFKHADRFTFGVPDLSFSLFGATGWIETKVTHRWPRLRKMLGVQRLNCQRLHRATHGKCWVVVFDELDGVQRTSIVDPHAITRDLTIEQVIAQFPSWDYRAVALFVKERLR